MKSPFLERGGMWVLLQAVLVVAIIGLGLGFHTAQLNRAIAVTGVIIMVAGVAFCAAGMLALGRQLTPFPKPLPQARLVRCGIYAYVRHPLYTSVFLGAIGWALLGQSWPALIVDFVFAAFLDVKARQEERLLQKQFPEYADYAKKTRRFIPRIY
jgi:protein-S-isoprenylcysteine O-methyltransferase Ste14